MRQNTGLTLSSTATGGTGQRASADRSLDRGHGIAALQRGARSLSGALPARHRKGVVVGPVITACGDRRDSRGGRRGATRDRLQGLAPPPRLAQLALGSRALLLPGLAPVVLVFEDPVEPVFNPAAQFIKTRKRTGTANGATGSRTRARASPGDPIHKLAACAHQPIQALLEGIGTAAGRRTHGPKLPAPGRQPALAAHPHQGDGEAAELQGPEEHAHGRQGKGAALSPPDGHPRIRAGSWDASDLHAGGRSRNGRPDPSPGAGRAR
jgi:hypothetical protein